MMPESVTIILILLAIVGAVILLGVGAIVVLLIVWFFKWAARGLTNDRG